MAVEVAGADAVEVAVVLPAPRRRTTIRSGSSPIRSWARCPPAAAATTPGRRAQPPPGCARCTSSRRLLGEARAPHVEAGRDEDAVGPEPGIDRHQVAQRAHEQQRARPPAPARAPSARRRGTRRRPKRSRCGGDAAPARLHGRAGSDVGGAQGGSEPEEHAREEGEARREREHARVGAARPRTARLASVLRNATRPALSQRASTRAGGGAGHGQEQALGHELAHDAAAGGADGEPDRDLALPRAGAGQHEVGQVRAGDEQHERGGGRAGPTAASRSRGAAWKAPVPAGRAVSVKSAVRLRRLRLPVARRDRLLEDRGRDRGELRGRLLHRPARRAAGRARSGTTSRSASSALVPGRGGLGLRAERARATSKLRPTSTPKKPGSVTPSDREGHARPGGGCGRRRRGSPPSSRCQNAWLTTTPGAAQPRHVVLRRASRRPAAGADAQRLEERAAHPDGRPRSAPRRPSARSNVAVPQAASEEKPSRAVADLLPQRVGEPADSGR